MPAVKRFLDCDISIPGALEDGAGETKVVAGNGQSSGSRPEYHFWGFHFDLVDVLGHNNLEGQIQFHQGVFGLSRAFELPLPQPLNHEFLGDDTPGVSMLQKHGGRFAVDHPSGAGSKYDVLANEIRLQNTTSAAVFVKTGRRVRFANHAKVYLLGGGDKTLAAGASDTFMLYPTLRMSVPHSTVLMLEPDLRSEWQRLGMYGANEVQAGGLLRAGCYVREAWRS